MQMSLSAPRNVAVKERIEFLPTGSYEFAPEKCKWLARIAWKLLHRLGALTPYSQAVKTYSYNKINEERLGALIFKSGIELERMFRKPGDFVLIMGQKTFDEAVMEFQDDLRFVGSMGVLSARTGPFGYENMQVRGFDVLIAPMMEGCALVPRVFVEKAQENPMNHFSNNRPLPNGLLSD